MKRVNTKEIKKYAEEICRNADLVEELGLMRDMKIRRLSGFSEDLQQAYYEAKDKEKFLKSLRKSVKNKVVEMLTDREVSTIRLVKYYFIFTEQEANTLVSKNAVLTSNAKRLMIIHEIEKLLVNTVQTDDEDRTVAKAVNKIYKSM